MAEPDGEAWRYFPLYAGMASFLTATLCWWFFIERKGTLSAARGLWVGALTAVVAHYVCWYLQIVGANVNYWLLDGSGSSLGEAPVDLLNGIWGAAGLSLFSYLAVGLITIPAGALIGLLCVFLVRNRVHGG